jgi:group I intron endonuclease
MVIYKTTNVVNGKVYIGQTVTNDESYLGSGVLLRYAISTYGRCNFKREILCECSSHEEMDKMEKYWISHFDSRNPDIGYNISSGGHRIINRQYGTFEGKNHTDLTKHKMSKNNGRYWLGKSFSNEHIEKIRKTSTGRNHSDETRLKMSESAKRRGKLPYEIREKIRLSKSIPIEIDGVKFESHKSAATHFGVHQNTISRWGKRKANDI